MGPHVGEDGEYSERKRERAGEFSQFPPRGRFRPSSGREGEGEGVWEGLANYLTARRRGNKFLPAALYSLALGTFVGIALGLVFTLLLQVLKLQDTDKNKVSRGKELSYVDTCHYGATAFVLSFIFINAAIADALLVDEAEADWTHVVQSLIAGVSASLSAWFIFGSFAYFIWTWSDQRGKIKSFGATPAVSAYGFEAWKADGRPSDAPTCFFMM